MDQNNQKDKNPDERDKDLDPQTSGEPMETEMSEINAEADRTTQQEDQQDLNTKVGTEDEGDLLKSSSQESTEARSENRPEKIKLSGAQRKKLGRLIKSGLSYMTARKTVIEQSAKRASAQPGRATIASHGGGNPVKPNQRTGGDKTTSASAVGKRTRSTGSTPEQVKKKARGASGPTYGAVAGSERVGITHQEHPGKTLSNTELTALQREVLRAVQGIKEGGPQVRF